MVAHFLTGLILGVLIGLAIAPFLRGWILWRQAREWDERYRELHDPSANDQA